MRMRLRKRNNKFNIYLILIVFLLCFIVIINFFSKRVTPVMLSYAESKAINLATLLITQSVNEEVNHVLADELIVTNKDKNGNVVEVDINPIYSNKLLNVITKNVQLLIENLEHGNIDSIGVSDTIFSNYDIHKLKQGIIFEFPSGIVLNNSMLSNLGPKIPVRLSLIGDVQTDLKTDIKSYGINNVFFKLIVYVEVNMKVILPFASSSVKASTDIPIVMKIIEGNVPNFYNPISS